MPYDRTTKDYPRSVVFAGTLNPDGNEYLQDTTGNRRFWPVEVAGVEGVSGGKFIDTDGLARDRNQLWAETVSRVGRGERIWTHDSGLQIAVEKEQRDRTYSDPWTEHIKSWVERYEEKQFTMVDILSLGLNIPVRDHDRRHQIRVSRILRELNVIKIHTLTGKKWLKIDQ
jgi:predicted P-loop ATPase